MSDLQSFLRATPVDTDLVFWHSLNQIDLNHVSYHRLPRVWLSCLNEIDSSHVKPSRTRWLTPNLFKSFEPCQSPQPSVFWSSSNQTQSNHVSQRNFGAWPFISIRAMPVTTPHPWCPGLYHSKSNQFEPCQLPQSWYLSTSLSKHFQSCRSPYYRFLAFQPTALSSIELFPSVTTPSVLTFQPIGFNQSEPLTCYYDHGIWPSAYQPFSATKATTTTTSVSGYQPTALPSHELLRSVSHHNLRCWLPAHRSTIIRATYFSKPVTTLSVLAFQPTAHITSSLARNYNFGFWPSSPTFTSS